MITIHDLIEVINKERLKRDFTREMTPANSKLIEQMCGGTFEAVVTGKGEEKCLIPQVGTLHFLYRGQNQEFIPCVPSLYRGNPTEEEVFVERMRLVVFKKLIDSHPAIKHFFKKHKFKVDEEGLAQHYGLKTEVLDLTSNLDIALFFATCWYDSANDCYHYHDDGKTHEAVLYVFIPILDNEPTPSSHENNYLNHNIRSIGLQAFPRPGIQEGYGLHIKRGASIKSYMYRFTFTCADSKYYFEKFKEGEVLWIKDKFINKVKQIIEQKEFSFSVFNETFRDFRPLGYSATKLKKVLPAEITLSSKVNDILFDDKEIQEMIADWNSETGAKMVATIYRKQWFEHEGIEDDGSGKSSGQIRGIHDKHDYRTLQRISIMQMLNFVGCPDPPEGAEWKNYKNTPRPAEKSRKDDDQWKKVPASMEDFFGKPFLTDNDWKI